MEKKIATCIIGGREYRLEPRTIEVAEMQNKLSTLATRFRRGAITMEGVLWEQLAFINRTTGQSPFAGIPPEELDIDDVTIACESIIKGYEKKVHGDKPDVLSLLAANGKKRKKKRK